MAKILIFDSGVGALSISKSLGKNLPYAELILLADNAGFPYGEMNEQLLIDRVTSLLIRAESELNPDCIVIACNTVSTIALDKIRNSISTPVIGVVPAIKPAARLSSSKVLGLLATPATIACSYTNDLVMEHAKECIMIAIGSTRMVEFAERKILGLDIDMTELGSILQPFSRAEKEQGLDTVILGCTHFPLISDLIAEILPRTILLVDSSDAIARRVKMVINETKNVQLEERMASEKYFKMEDNQAGDEPPRYRCFLTQTIDSASFNIGLKHFGFKTIEYFK